MKSIQVEAHHSQIEAGQTAAADFAVAAVAADLFLDVFDFSEVFGRFGGFRQI